MLDLLAQFDREKLPAKSFHIDDGTGHDATSWRTWSQWYDELFAIQQWLIYGLTYLEVPADWGLSVGTAPAPVPSGLLIRRLVLPEFKEGKGKIAFASTITKSYAHAFLATSASIVRSSRRPPIISKESRPSRIGHEVKFQSLAVESQRF